MKIVDLIDKLMFIKESEGNIDVNLMIEHDDGFRGFFLTNIETEEHVVNLYGQSILGEDFQLNFNM